jgi:hypothetical protein
MWLLSFLPDSLLMYIINGVLVVGAVSFFLSFFVLHRILNKFPALAPYHLVIQIISVVLLVSGIYFKGGYSTEMMWRERVKEVEAKVAAAEAKSKETNTVIQTQYRDKVKTVKEVQIVVQERIVKEAVQMDSECKVDANAISILNQAAGGKK